MVSSKGMTMFFKNTLDDEVRKILSSFREVEYINLFKTILKHQRKILGTDDKSNERYFLTAVNEALDDMWQQRGKPRHMGTYLSFMSKRKELYDNHEKLLELREKAELKRLLAKYGNEV